MHVRSGHDWDCVRAVNLHIVISQLIFNCELYLKLTYRIESNLQDLKSNPEMMISMIEKSLLAEGAFRAFGCIVVRNFVNTLLTVVKKTSQLCYVDLNFAELDLTSTVMPLMCTHRRLRPDHLSNLSSSGG